MTIIKLCFIFSHLMFYCYPFIHPSSSAYPGPGRRGSSLSRDAQTSLSLDTSSCPPGGYQGVPKPTGRHNPSSVSCVFSGVSSWWDAPGAPPQEVSRWHPEQMPEPPQLAPLDVEEQRLYSELLKSDQAPHPISKGPKGMSFRS